MHAYHEILKNEDVKKAITGAISHIIEIEWNAKADPITKFRQSVDKGAELYTKLRFIDGTDTDKIFAAYKPYVNDSDVNAALTNVWNYIRKEHLSQIPGYLEYVKFYHDDEEDPMDPPTITTDQIAAWVDEYIESRR